jgi:hypothetical protein
VRELSYRDLGGLMFDLHRFGGRRDELVAAKLNRLGETDTELRAIERTLEDRQPVTVLREAGVVACLRCAAIHSSEDNFCPHCGLSVSRDTERPLSTADAPPASSPAAEATPAPAPHPAAPPPAAPITAARVAAAPPAATAAQPAPAPAETPRQPPVPARATAAPAAAGASAPSMPTPEPAAAAPVPTQQYATTAPAKDAPATSPPEDSPPSEQAKGDESDGSIEQPTQIVRRPERPEGSGAE